MVGRLTARVTALITWFQGTRLGRLNARYSAANGAQLAGGIAYAALFSVFAVLTIAFTVFARIIGDDAELLAAVVSAIDQALPGLIQTPQNPQAPLSPSSLVLTTGLNLATVVAAVTLLFSALAVMGSLASSLRAMFGLVAPPGNVVITKLRDLAGFLVLALAVFTTAVLGIGVGVAGSWLTGVLNLDSAVGAFLVRAFGVLVALAVDAVVFAALMRFVAGARPPAKDLWLGSLIGAIGTGVLRFAGTSLVGGASANALLASFAALVTLLLWVNLAARLALYVAAFTANPPGPGAPVPAVELHTGETPNFVTMSVPATLRWDHDSRTGIVQPSEADRIAREDEQRERERQRHELGLALDQALTESAAPAAAPVGPAVESGGLFARLRRRRRSPRP